MNKVVVYYSYTNHTKKIAELISNNLGCDMIEIIPKSAYSDNYDEVVEIAKEETNKNVTPEINEIDLSSYDTIILGMPVWWYTFAPPVRTFLTTNNLDSKTIIPFATNAGWLGHTFEDIKEICHKSKVVNEMNLVFTSNYRKNDLVTPKEDVDNWLNELKKL